MKLFSKFLFIMFAAAACILAAAGTFFYYSVRTALQDHIGATQLEVTRQVSDKLDHVMYERGLDVRGLATRPENVHVLAKSATAADVTTAAQNLENFRALSPFWNDFEIIDNQGAVRVDTDKGSRPAALLTTNPSLADLYRQALSGHAVYSDAFLEQPEGRPTVVYMAPLKDGAATVGVLAGSVAWSSIQDVLTAVKGSHAILLSHSGALIGDSAPTPGELFKTDYSTTSVFTHVRGASAGAAGILPRPDKPSEQAITSYAEEQGYLTYPGNGWYLALATPTSVALLSVQHLTLELILVFTLLIVLAIVILFWQLNRKVMRPIRALTAAVTRITLGDLSQSIPESTEDELGSLGRSFNEMTHQLSATHRALQETTREATEGRAQLESSINGLRQGFILTDASGKFILSNAAARDLEHPESMARNHKSATAFATADLEKLLPTDLRLAERIKRTMKSREQSKFASLPVGGRFINLYLSPVTSGKAVIGCVLLLEDVTEERIIQRSRDEFFSIASHELRTPLTAIRGNTSLIKENFPKVIKNHDVKEMIDDIHESSVRLIEIVNDFLDVSRLEQDKMKFVPTAFSIEPVIEKIIYEMSGMSRDKNITLSFDQNTLGDLPEVYADPSRVKQVLYNLVGNGMKFTTNGGVVINCLREKDKLKICVSDTGPGISLEGQQLLFHKFQQTADSILTRDGTRGTGLGLYISKLLVEHMKGTIRLEHTELGKGTTFSFTLPTTKDGGKV